MRSIPEIDVEIDANRAELRQREPEAFRGRPLDCLRWQIAWDRHPDLRERDRALFRERGRAQLIRDGRSDSSPVAERRLRDLLAEMALESETKTY